MCLFFHVTLVLFDEKPKAPRINVYVFSELANQSIHVDLVSGSVEQWFDLPKFYNLYKSKEQKLITSEVELTSDMLKCKEYITSNGSTTSTLKTLREFNAKATNIAVDNLVKEQSKHLIIPIDFCDTCNQWEHLAGNRCSCGNRRCAWESDGDFLSKDVYIYPASY